VLPHSFVAHALFQSCEPCHEQFQLVRNGVVPPQYSLGRWWTSSPPWARQRCKNEARIDTTFICTACCCTRLTPRDLQQQHHQRSLKLLRCAGTYDFRSRGISDQEGLQSVLRSLANWMRMLEEKSAGGGTLAPMQSSAAENSQNGGDSVPGGSILLDPRAGPLLSSLRSEALRIIGEVRACMHAAALHS
jgi:hypothetical protein